MNLPQRKKLGHTTPNWLGGCPVFFVTVCGERRGENQFCTAEASRAIFEATAFYQGKQRWYVHRLLLMPDPLHMLVSFPASEAMTAVIKGWKHFLAKQHGLRWQRDFFDHRVRGDESFEEKAHYIRQNPVRAGRVRTADEWTSVWEPVD